MSEPREFPNPFPDFANEILLDSTSRDSKIEKVFSNKLESNVKYLLSKLEKEYAVDWKDSSVYTGTSGVALMYFHLYECLDGGDKDYYLSKAATYVDGALKNLRHRTISFLCGDAGPLAVGAVVYSHIGKKEKSDECIKRLTLMQDQVMNDSDLPDELLFGRAGFLFALLFVNHHLAGSIDQKLLSDIAKRILQSGQEMSVRERSRSRLMYEWHEKKYLGAAHGLTGILYILMKLNDSSLKRELNELVQPTVDFLMTLRYPSGNYPSSIGSSSGDKLVHWCHGAPGWVYMFILAYEVFGDSKYLEAAKGCGEVLWTRGILRKGYGICHGVSGNGYGLLALYNVTKEEKYLFYTTKFAEWCFDYNKHGCRTPDRPYSLFEGLAGTIYFLADVIRPRSARFPAYEL